MCLLCSLCSMFFFCSDSCLLSVLFVVHIPSFQFLCFCSFFCLPSFLCFRWLRVLSLLWFAFSVRLMCIVYLCLVSCRSLSFHIVCSCLSCLVFVAWLLCSFLFVYVHGFAFSLFYYRFFAFLCFVYAMHISWFYLRFIVFCYLFRSVLSLSLHLCSCCCFRFLRFLASCFIFVSLSLRFVFLIVSFITFPYISCFRFVSLPFSLLAFISLLFHVDVSSFFCYFLTCLLFWLLLCYARFFQFLLCPLFYCLFLCICLHVLFGSFGYCI